MPPRNEPTEPETDAEDTSTPEVNDPAEKFSALPDSLAALLDETTEPEPEPEPEGTHLDAGGSRWESTEATLAENPPA